MRIRSKSRTDRLKMVMAKAINKKSILLVLGIAIIMSLRISKIRDNSSVNFPIPFEEPQDDYLPSLYLEDTSSVSKIGLEYDFYRQSCPQAESIVRSTMARIFSEQNDVSPALLRLVFHDCFIEGCDASVLLDDNNGNQNHAIERQAIPNRSLRGFDKIDMIKEELEKACPGIVSCSDILALATRDGIVLAGGPFYPVFTGRRDSLQSFFGEASAQIPRPTDNISQILNEFSVRGFNERDTVSLLGGHNIGKISCKFIQDRVHNFSGTGRPDPSLPSDLRNEIINTCENNNSSSGTDGSLSSMRSRRTNAFSQGLSSSMSLGSGLDSHYFQRLLKGRGLLFSDQQLMADDRTASLVRAYASDDGSTFRFDFSRAMVKLSNLGVLTDSQGEVRTICSLPFHNS